MHLPAMLNINQYSQSVLKLWDEIAVHNAVRNYRNVIVLRIVPRLRNNW